MENNLILKKEAFVNGENKILFYANTRKIRRQRARKKMEKEGIKHINKRDFVFNPMTRLYEKSNSFFKENWRTYGEI